MHSAARRRAGAVVPASRGHRHRGVGDHGRGPRLHRGHAPGAAGVPRVPRAAVRLLHAGVPDHGGGVPRRQPRAHRGRGARGDQRQPVPLHRLPEHRGIRPAGGRAHPLAGDVVTTRLFGERVPRVEDARLVTGGAHFLDDLGHGALAAAFVRSPYAHARVTDIDVTRALDVEGLVAIYTYDDLAASPDGTVAEALPLLIPHPALHAPRTGYALARDEVNHVGEAVVMVVARDRYLAEDAAGRVVVTYEQLPVVVGVDNARRAERTVHDDVPDNVAAHNHDEVGNVEAALAAAPHTLTLSLDIERSASMPMEGKGVHARWDPVDSSMRVHSSTQTSTSVRAAVAAKLALPLGKVECVAPMVGGGFGVKIVPPWPEEVLVPWAAKRLGQEVKWVEDRREHFVSSAHERGQLQEVTAGYDDEGRLLALDVRFWHDNGAYTPYGVIVPIITSTQLLGPYKPRAYRCEWWS